MSRSDYDYEIDNWASIRWRGAVASAIRGKRGQSMLRELADALDALPEKRLAADSLIAADGSYCTLGALGKARGMNLEPIDPEDWESVARAFGVAEALAREIMYLNDEYFESGYKIVEMEICGPMRPYWPEFGKHKRLVNMPDDKAAENRWRYMRNWVKNSLQEGATA